MITNFKIYENRGYPAIQFKDDYLIVHKVTEGVNKGRIKIRFDKDNNGKYESNHSLLFGIAILLDTEYEKNEEFRKIKISDTPKFRKVQLQTVDLILRSFLKYIGYEQNFNIPTSTYYTNITDLQLKFTDYIKNILVDSNDLGDVFDRLRNVRNIIIEFKKDHYKEYVRNNDMNKYNL